MILRFPPKSYKSYLLSGEGLTLTRLFSTPPQKLILLVNPPPPLTHSKGGGVHFVRLFSSRPRPPPQKKGLHCPRLFSTPPPKKEKQVLLRVFPQSYLLSPPCTMVDEVVLKDAVLLQALSEVPQPHNPNTAPHPSPISL